MTLFEIILIALGLSLDSFAVSVTAGTILAELKWRRFVRIALYMGFFQGLMPLLGWFAGTTFQQYIQECDHWIAFGLLLIIGGKMIYEGICDKDDDEKRFDPTRSLTLLGLAVATSIDALAVGVSFAMLRIKVILPVIIIALVTFAMSFLGTYLGSTIGNKLRLRIEILGGTILILIGTKILIEHLGVL